MDKKLKDELREFGLLPVSLDEEAQAEYRRLGLDPSKIESHYTPGTPEGILNRQMAIDRNVQRLHEMEFDGQTASVHYNEIVEQIRKDLGYIRTQGLHMGYKKATGGVELTELAEIFSACRAISRT